MDYLLFGVAIVLVAMGIAVLQGIPYYSPLMISSAVWLLVLVTGLFVSPAFYPITDTAFLLWLLWFAITSAFYFVFSVMKRTPSHVPPCRLPLDYSLIVIGLIVWLAWRTWELGSTGPEHFFLNLRLSAIGLEGFERLGILERIYPVVFALFLFEIVHSRPGNRHLRFLLWVWMLLYAVTNMGKFALLTPIVAWLVVKGVQGKMTWRLPALVVLLTLPLMGVLHFVRAGADYQKTVAEDFGVYTYSPIVALGHLTADATAATGAYTFRLFYAVMNRLFDTAPPEAVILPYVDVPYATNVYTVMQPFFYDFGAAGVVIGALFYGLIFGLLFYMARSTRTLPVMLYAGFAIALVGQFIGDLFITTLSGNLQFLIAAGVIVFLSKRKAH